MSSDNINQLAAQLIILKNKIPKQNSGLFFLVSDKLKKLSHWESLDDPFNELCNLYQILNASSNTNLFSKLKLRKTVEQINIILLDCIGNQFVKKTFSANTSAKKNKKPSVSVTKPRPKLFITIAVLGSILAALSGAAAIQSIFSAFVSIVAFPVALVVTAQILFASIAVLAFYVFELNTIGKSLGVRPFELGVLFNLYGQQSHSFKEIFRAMQKEFRHCTEFSEYEKLQKKYEALTTSYANFTAKLAEAEKAKQPNRIKNIAQILLTIFGAAIFGGLAAVGAQPVLTTFLPILLGASLASGPVGLAITATIMVVCVLAGAGIFVLMERNGERLINKIWGTPTKAINKLLDRHDKIYNEIIKDIDATKADKLNYFKEKQKSEMLEKSYKSLQESIYTSSPREVSTLPQLLYPKLPTRSSIEMKYKPHFERVLEENSVDRSIAVK